MASASTKLMTADEFWDFVHRPENAHRDFELVRGEVGEMTKPGRWHGFVCANVAGILRDYARKRKKGYVCSNDTGVVVETDPDTVRGPDVQFLEDAGKPEEIDRKWGSEPPRLAVEVLSPTDTVGRVNERIQGSTQPRYAPGLACRPRIAHGDGVSPRQAALCAEGRRRTDRGRRLA
jgi:Uma2 family endonuclease